MTSLILRVGVVLSCLGAVPCSAQTPRCGPILDNAIDAPIPDVLINANTIMILDGEKGILSVLAKHVASVPIEWMPGVYVGLVDNVSECMTDGCDAFVFVASNGIAAVSGTLRMDSHSTLWVWDYHAGVPDADNRAILPRTFYEHGIDYRQQTLAMIVSALTEINIYWAGMDEVVENVDDWISRGNHYITIPLHALEQQDRLTPFTCPF